MLNTKHVKVTNRDIAKMLCKSLPLEGQEFSAQVELAIETVRKLKPQARLALSCAYIFSAKCPRQDREDLFQDIALAVLKSGAKDEALAYSIARCDWRDWYEKRYFRDTKNAGSLDVTIEDGDGNEILASELLVGEVEFEAKECDYLDASTIWQKLPEEIRPIVQKRLTGLALTGTERSTLCRFTKTPKASKILATLQS